MQKLVLRGPLGKSTRMFTASSSGRERGLFYLNKQGCGTNLPQGVVTGSKKSFIHRLHSASSVVLAFLRPNASGKVRTSSFNFHMSKPRMAPIALSMSLTYAQQVLQITQINGFALYSSSS